MIDNPAYKGPWKPKMISNPAYKGEWVHPEVPNPDYAEDKELYVRCKQWTHIGFELWQVKSGTIFDDIIVSDSFEEAKAYAESTFVKDKAAEQAAFDAYEAKRNEAASAASATTDSKPSADEDEEDENDEL